MVDLLFDAVRPSLSVFGEKDLQQVAVVKRLARERHPNLEVVVGALVRDDHGLALSSRNARLDEEGLVTARRLSRTLREMQEACAKGGDVAEAVAAGREALDTTPGVTLEYLDVVDAKSFEPSRGARDQEAHVVVAAHVQGVRLIDNAPLRT